MLVSKKKISGSVCGIDLDYIIVKILFITSGMKGFKYLFIIIFLQIWYKYVSCKQHFSMKRTTHAVI